MIPDKAAKEIENSLIKMSVDYGYFLGENELSTLSEDWLYIVDAETYELMLIKNHKNIKELNDCGDWRGRKCYDFLEGRSSPCPFCNINQVRSDSHYVWIHYNNILKKTLFQKDIIIDWNGRKAMLQTVVDISSVDRKNEVMYEYILSRNVLTNVLTSLSEERALKDIFKDVCFAIGDFFGADRVLITSYSLDNLSTIWSRSKDIPDFVQVRTSLTQEGKEHLAKATANMRYIAIPDVANAEKLDPKLKSYWLASGIRSMLFVPMIYNGDFVGAISLHNISAHRQEISTLYIVAMAVAKNIYSNALEADAELRFYSDPLTGALNLSGLKKRTLELMNQYPENRYCFSIIDIRYFGAINRRFGFDTGDKILKTIADILCEIIGEDEVFCRIASDQFGIVAKFKSIQESEKLYEGFMDKMQCFPELVNAGVKIEFQIGTYLPEPGEKFSVSQAIDKANIARRTLKNFHGSKMVFFRNEMLEKGRREIELVQDFKNAIPNGEITVFYQPQCLFSENKIAGAEALVRWKSPKHGYVSPAEFIPLLERHGLIYDLDRFVWEYVCKQQSKLIDMGFNCPISVNVSRNDLLRNNFCNEIIELFDKYSIPKALIPLEITETAYINSSDELISVVNMLKDWGFTVEMDDFGSGYSSLNALKDVSVDLLKLDMKFLDNTKNTEKGRSILNCIVRMARWLNLAVLAEGVETVEQAEYLTSIGCDLMQGYYFAKPMPAESFEEMLIKSSSSGLMPIRSKEKLSISKFIESATVNPIFFNNIGAAAIIEYYDGKCEALLINDNFLEAIGCKRSDYSFFISQINKYAAAIKNSSESDNASEKLSKNNVYTHDFKVKRPDGVKTIFMFCRKIMTDADKLILLITLDDITDSL